MKTYAALFGIAIGLLSMAAGAFTFMMFPWRSDLQLTLIAGFIILVLSIHYFPQSEEVEEDEVEIVEKEVIREMYQ